MSQEPLLSKDAKRPLAPYICLAIFLLTLISGPLFFVSLYIKAPTTEAVTIIIPRGSSVKDIAKRLDKNDLVIHPMLFRISAKFMAGNKLQAGEYNFPAGLNVLETTKMLKDGANVVRQLTIPEGLTSHEIKQIIEAEKTLVGPITEFIPEGSLLPETYHYSYGDSRANFVKRMQSKQKELLEKLWANRDQSVPVKTMADAIILASIVEKETGPKAEERPLVASVFANRLRKGMPLQSDPTVIYALTYGKASLGRSLLRKDLSVDSPINTYKYPGLPPQPICNPGQAAIEAVMHPTHSNYIYFVADGTGGHAFAKTLKEHNRNVANWIKVRKKKKAN